jgi:hypothetical protein
VPECPWLRRLKSEGAPALGLVRCINIAPVTRRSPMACPQYTGRGEKVALLLQLGRRFLVAFKRVLCAIVRSAL